MKKALIVGIDNYLNISDLTGCVNDAHDVVIVICGKYTDTAKGVTAELTITQEEGVPYFFLCGRADGNVVKPLGANTFDKIYKWTWDNLKALINGAR